MDTTRHYKNHFEDYSTSVSHNIIENNCMIHDEFKSLLTLEIKKLMKTLKENEKKWYNNDDYSVYTGSAGIAFTLYYYGKYYNDSAYIKTATDILKKCATNFKSKHKVTFLTGVVGPLALAAVILYSQGKKEEMEQLIFNGVSYSSSNHCQSPLMYSWHDKEYIGGAHGIAGVLYLLLQARHYLTQVQIDNYLKPSLYYLQRLQFSSGNFPSSTGNPSDKLIQWCHGAPGISILFCLAYKVFEDNTFLETAIRCGEVTWERGLLKKGYSICHGVAGNGYTFIYLFQQTKDVKYLYRACKFAEWCFHYGSHQNRCPDRPFSLFEGLAGVIYFLLDVQQPHLAKFPTYDITIEQ
ncbi:LanC-like protein 1 [Camponotus floridanus]|uniref:LanC-like protein 1 n=1 Tax=Camponotus floridanus TaxID=104421 RepID=E2A0R7_CAMFO|nr:LanC-like protein 1 [Camponotus floridanus]